MSRKAAQCSCKNPKTKFMMDPICIVGDDSSGNSDREACRENLCCFGRGRDDFSDDEHAGETFRLKTVEFYHLLFSWLRILFGFIHIFQWTAIKRVNKSYQE